MRTSMVKRAGAAGFVSLVFGLSVGLATDGVAQSAEDRLWDAARAGDTMAVAAALADGADINALDTRTNPNGRRALNWAAWFNRVPVIHQLLANGAEVNAVNNTGFTPIHHAAESGSLQAAEALLAAGADVTIPNLVGRLPVETARSRGYVDLVKILEAAGP